MRRLLSLVPFLSCFVFLGNESCPSPVSVRSPGLELPPGCVEYVVECPYRSFTEADYNPNAGLYPDPYVCFEGDYVEYAWQESCPDNDIESEECGGPEALLLYPEDGTVCAACSTLDGDAYEGHPTYTGPCDSGDNSCVTQAEPPWTVIRIAVCVGDDQ